MSFFVLRFMIAPLVSCLSFFALRLMIAPLVSSNFSYLSKFMIYRIFLPLSESDLVNLYTRREPLREKGATVIVIVWWLALQLPVQSMSITTKVVSWNSVHGEVYSIQHYVIKFVSDMRQVGSFLRVLRFPPPINVQPQHN